MPLSQTVSGDFADYRQIAVQAAEMDGAVTTWFRIVTLPRLCRSGDGGDLRFHLDVHVQGCLLTTKVDIRRLSPQTAFAFMT